MKNRVNIGKLAKELGMSRQNLYKLLWNGLVQGAKLEENHWVIPDKAIKQLKAIYLGIPEKEQK